MSERESDIVQRALADLLATPGPDKPPADVTERVLCAIQDRQLSTQSRDNDQRPFQQQVAWLPLAACVLVMVVGSWLAGSHAALRSQVAGQRVNSDGSVWVMYSDGRTIPISTI